MAAENEAEAMVPEEVAELLEQRDTYREWLAALDETAADARPEVRRKVRADYQGRLADVEEELISHLEELEESLTERREEARGLEEERETTAGDLEEADIRHRVGEYTDEEWEERKEELGGRLEEIEENLDAARRAVERLETILEELAAGATGPPPGRAGRPGDREGGGEERQRPSTGPGPGDSGAEAGGAAGADAVESGGGAPEETADREAHEDELDFLESLSLDDPGTFDSLAALLDEEAGGPERGEEEEDEEADDGRSGEGG